MQFSKNDALSLVRMMRTTLNEKFKKVDNSLKAVEEKMPYDLSGIADDSSLSQTSFISILLLRKVPAN